MSKIFVDLLLHVFYTFAIKMWCYNKKYSKIEKFKKFFQFGLNDSFLSAAHISLHLSLWVLRRFVPIKTKKFFPVKLT